MLSCPLPGRSSGCGILSWFVPPALAGEVAREAAAERDAALAAAGEKVPQRRARLLRRTWPSTSRWRCACSRACRTRTS